MLTTLMALTATAILSTIALDGLFGSNHLPRRSNSQ